MKLKISSIAFAAAALCAAQAQAAVTVLSGASASSINAAKALVAACEAGGNTAVVSKSASTTLNTLTNIFTVKCSADFDGTLAAGIDEVRFNVSGGSLGAVLNSTGYGNVAIARLNPALSSCTALAAGTEALSFLTAGKFFNCTGAAGLVNDTGDGGFLDVSGDIFAANGQALPGADVAADFVQSTFLQAFAVGVSKSMYNMLQEYQTAKGLLPATCAPQVAAVFTASENTLPVCQPSVSRAQVAALISNFNSNLKKAGVNAFIGGTATTQSDLGTAVIATLPALKTNITYWRRPDTSGTQASAQLYFLSAPTASGDLGGLQVISGAGTYNSPVTTTVTVGSGTGNVITGLNAAGYALGIVSAENNPLSGSDTYRFVKLNNVSVTEGVSVAAGATNTVEAIRGNYDFVYESFKFCPGGTCNPILDVIEANVLAGSSSPGLFLTSEAKATRGGKATSPYRAK